jgi:hypothetical protein
MSCNSMPKPGTSVFKDRSVNCCIIVKAMIAPKPLHVEKNNLFFY